MLFQTFDDKQKCALAYHDKKLVKNLEELNLTHTWSYATYLKDLNIEYAQLWVEGKKLSTVCPSSLQRDLDKAERKIKALIRSCYESKLNLDDICFYDLAPQSFLKEYAEIKNAICTSIFERHTKPQNYDHILNLVKVTTEIRHRSLDLDLKELQNTTLRDRNIIRGIKNGSNKIQYDPFRTKTGRLATISNSFPILTLSKEYRKVVKPTNDWLYELDFNAAELRTVLGLLEHDQPKEDLHDWNIKNLFPEVKSRDEAKKKIFGWLYNANSSDNKINSIYNRKKIKSLFYKDGQITTPYHREIECDDFHAVNYMIQSTAADLLFEQMYKVWKFLEGKKSFVKFCNHDSIVVDLAAEDQADVHTIKNIFTQTRFGDFKVSCTGGKNWGAMRKLNIF